MKKSRYSENQIMTILKQTESGTPVPALCREHGMSSATFYSDEPNSAAWMPLMMKRMKEPV